MPSGHIEDGETAPEAAVRELDEEVGLTVEVDSLRLIAVVQNYLDIAYTSFMFVADKWSGEPVIGEPDKASGVAFFAVDALPKKCTLGVRVLEVSGFSDEMAFIPVNPSNFETFMGEPFNPETWGKN